MSKVKVTIILFVVGHLISILTEHSKQKQFYTVNTYAKKLKPEDFNIKIHPNYIIKSSHDIVINLINQGEKKILITGITGLGKTRTAYEVIKDFGIRKDYFVVIPSRQIKLPLWVPRNFLFFERKFILVFDDLDKYIREKVEITSIINEFEKNSQHLIVVATCNKEELEILKKENFYEENVYEVFKIVEQDLLSNEDGKKLAESIGKKFDPKEFDGSAGSIVFDSCKKKKYWTGFSESEKNILKSVQLLHLSNIFLPHIDLLRNVYVKIFKQDNQIFNSNFDFIEKMDFLYRKENIIYCLDYYLVHVVEAYPLGNQLLQICLV